jgi:peptidoglycan/xylan/chitin deacetylase (PgdA/CDA1 family)
MFHHFHGENHLPAQGSLSSLDFKEMIEWLRQSHTILDATEYIDKFREGKLGENDICLSLDDGLKCQYDIALPVLEQLQIKAFFFAYSSAFGDEPDPLEIYRYFRTAYFSEIDEFYSLFFQVAAGLRPAEYSASRSRFLVSDYLSNFPFYSENDKWFRYLRDQFLAPEDYHHTMKKLMVSKNFDTSQAKQVLWMTEKEIIDLDARGHEIGLHSFTHPTQMSKLGKDRQQCEYLSNYEHLSNLLRKPVRSMSHPCGDYSQTTLGILSELGIEIGFRSSMSVKETLSPLEIPREDHANVLTEMRR